MTSRPRPLRLALVPVLFLASGTFALAASPAASPAGSAASAAPAPPPAQQNGLQTPDYRIETSETHWNFNTGEFSMPHRVKFYRPGTDATGDRATGNSKNGTATLYGHVVVHDSGNTATSVGSGAYSGSGPATLTCDQLDVDSKAKLYTATGHVHFSQGTRSGSASKAILNRANGTLHLEGDVHLSDSGSTLIASSVDYNLNTKDVQVLGSPAEMSQPEHAPAMPGPPTPRPTKQPAKHAGKPAPRPRATKSGARSERKRTPARTPARTSPAHESAPRPSARPAPQAKPAPSPRPSPLPHASTTPPPSAAPSPKASGAPR
ncbi:MAG TPA: LptA/OstA family protein [Candidatus Baltobacteraceae bacterium]|nr:LptA/OstA family protein [Candidatus Baltobacteraceae bacterium]